MGCDCLKVTDQKYLLCRTRYRILTAVCDWSDDLIWYAFSALTLLVGQQERHPAFKNRVVGCWCGCLSGARCWLAYGPADATATHCLLLQWNPDWFLFFWYWLTWVVPEKGPSNGCACVCAIDLTRIAEKPTWVRLYRTPYFHCCVQWIWQETVLCICGTADVWLLELGCSKHCWHRGSNDGRSAYSRILHHSVRTTFVARYMQQHCLLPSCCVIYFMTVITVSWCF